MIRVAWLCVGMLALVSICGCPETIQVCIPDCEGKECGDDGCAGTCGTCPADEACSDSGSCEPCTPDCLGRECGGDGCGGSCQPGCAAGQTCNTSGRCGPCEPDCTGRDCGDNGCGVSCGACALGEVCNASGQCFVCTPDCAAKTCCEVDDICGVSCQPVQCGPLQMCGPPGESCGCCDCLIEDACFDAEDLKPGSACQVCNPNGSGGATAWTNLPEGESCDLASGVCHEGECCTPDCTSATCCSPGDGCGGTCASAGCDATEVCVPGACTCVAASDLYVDNDPGVDCGTGDGSQGSPFCTIGEALSLAVFGTRIHVATGLYEEVVNIPEGSPAGIQILGDTRPGYTVIGSPSASPVVQIGGVSDGVDGVVLRDLTVEMGGEFGIVVDGSWDVALERVRVRQTGVGATADGKRSGVVALGGRVRLSEVDVGPIESTAIDSEVVGIKSESSNEMRIEDSVVHDLTSGAGGIATGIRPAFTQTGTITGCEIRNLNSTESSQANGYEITGILLERSDGWTVQFTQVHDLLPAACSTPNQCKVHGIAVKNSGDFTSYRNRIHRLGPEGLEQIRGYHIQGQAGDVITLQNDLIHDLAGAASTDGGASGVWVGGAPTVLAGRNLTIARIGLGAPVTQNTGVYCADDRVIPGRVQLSNSIVSQVEGVGLSAEFPDELVVSHVALYECSVDFLHQVSCAGCLTGLDPLFVDPDQDDYHLRPASPCIDAGDGSDCSNEPDCPPHPINLGAYGNTDEAAVSAWVQMPGGAFAMGTDGGATFERPAHAVTVPPFEMMRTEVTTAEYELCHQAGGCFEVEPGSGCNFQAPGRENDPINCLTWYQAQYFCAWITPGGRLPSEAEWEWAARSGGSADIYPWGNTIAACQQANADPVDGCQDFGTWPVCSFASGNSAMGLCDLAGNVAEWVEDEWHINYVGAPDDGSAWEGGGPTPANRVVRGGGYDSAASALTATSRSWQVRSTGTSRVGLRCVR